MQVYGDLISLPDDEEVLVPLPFYCRVPLGLRSGTPVHLALVVPSWLKDATRYPRPPDLVATLVDPLKWDSTWEIRFTGPDGPGILHALLKGLRAWNEGEGAENSDLIGRVRVNVVLGESVTLANPTFTDSDGSFPGVVSAHETVLFLEPESQSGRADAVETALESVRKRLETDRNVQGCRLIMRKFRAPGRMLDNLGCPTVSGGMARLPFSWGQLRGMLSSYTNEDAIDFDLKCAAFSTDVTSRMVRAVFPRVGAMRLEFEHRDVANTFSLITEALVDCGYNILASHLSQSGNKTATLTAAFEPAKRLSPDEISSSEQRLKTAFDLLARPTEAAGAYIRLRLNKPKPFRHALQQSRRPATLIEELREVTHRLLSKDFLELQRVIFEAACRESISTVERDEAVFLATRVLDQLLSVSSDARDNKSVGLTRPALLLLSKIAAKANWRSEIGLTRRPDEFLELEDGLKVLSGLSETDHRSLSHMRGSYSRGVTLFTASAIGAPADRDCVDSYIYRYACEQCAPLQVRVVNGDDIKSDREIVDSMIASKGVLFVLRRVSADSNALADPDHLLRRLACISMALNRKVDLKVSLLVDRDLVNWPRLPSSLSKGDNIRVGHFSMTDFKGVLDAADGAGGSVDGETVPARWNNHDSLLFMIKGAISNLLGQRASVV